MGLRPAASTTAPSNIDTSDAAATIMAPALTEPVSHQSKISSPAQAASPRPIISEIVDQQLNNRNNNSGQYLCTKSVVKTVTATATTTTSAAVVRAPAATDQVPPTTDDVVVVQEPNSLSNGPANGPLAVTHMDHTANNDSPAQPQHDQQQQHYQHQPQQSPQSAELPTSTIAGHATSASATAHAVGDNPSDESESDRVAAIGQELLNMVEQGHQEQQLQLLEQTLQATFDQADQAESQQEQQQQTLQPNTGTASDASEKEVPQELVRELAQAACSQTLDLLGDAAHNIDDTAASSQCSGTSSNNNIMSKDFMKETAEMEQMLGELASSSDIDLLQVFKSFETAPAGENLCDLAGGLSLFNDVDVMNMNMGLEDVVTNTSPVKECPTQEMLAEIEKKRAKMIRDCDFMMRRLRKIQARHMGRHISEEMYGVYEYAQNLIKRKERESKSISTMAPINQLHGDKHKSVSSLKTMLKRIENVATTQQTSPGRMVNQTFVGSSSSLSSTTVTSGQSYGDNRDAGGFNKHGYPTTATIVPPFDLNGVQQLQHCSGLLAAELKVVNDAFDSDATASSSGGESADELVNYNNVIQQPLPIAKRAAWRWARDRARIASRWTWLLAQISDLDYRIRQHHELYLLLKKNSGTVKFEGSPNNDTVPLEPAMYPPPLQHHAVNGYRGILPGNLRHEPDVKEEDDCGSSARTRAFQAHGFRKRKLLQSTNLHKISKKVARPCNIKCGCRWPVHPCLLCTGRQDPTAPRDLPDMLSKQEKIALLDPCFHPILSFPEDESYSIQFEGVLRQPEWQTKTVRSSSKSVIKGALAMQKSVEREERTKKNSESTSNSKKLSNKKLGLPTNKVRKARNNNRKMKKAYSQLMKNNNKSRKNSHISAGSDIGHEMDIASPNGSVSRSINPSPTPGSSHRYERIYTERRNKNAYDIDNIVIPYSMAASNRVEVLSYKEIPTPKWRVIEDTDESTSQTKTETTAADEPVNTEDITAENFQQRHERALNEERKRFSTFLKFPYSTRSRANRRIDSQADSSGANTPDPTSPAPSTPAPSSSNDPESVPSPAAPATPQPAEGENTTDNVQFSQPPPVTNNGAGTSVPTSAIKAERRRTVSLRKISEAREELLRRSHTPDIRETIPPFEPLAFPLPNDTLDHMIQSMPTDYKAIIEDCISNIAEVDTTAATAAAIKALESSTSTTTNNLILGDRFPHMLLEGDSDETESAVSGALEEDPNDPEWIEPPVRS